METQTRSESTLRNCSFAIAGVSVEVGSKRAADVVLIPSLLPFQAEVGPAPDITIQIEWMPSLHERSEPWIFDSGAVWRMYDGDEGFIFDFRSSILGKFPYKRLLVDRSFHKAVLQMNEAYFADGTYNPCPLEYPLDELLIMHRLTQEKAIELHGSGIVRPNGDGNLFMGHSGAGKSTTTRLWTSREEVEVLSDDRIIVRPDEEKRADAVGAPSTSLGISARGSDAAQAPQLRLRDCSASRSNHFAQDDKSEVARGGMRMYGTPWHGEAMFASPGSAPLTRIFVLEHGRGNLLTRLTKSQAVAELFARSFVPFHRHEYVESALEFLQEVAEAVPCYRYSFEPDQGAVEKILEFRD